MDSIMETIEDGLAFLQPAEEEQNDGYSHPYSIARLPTPCQEEVDFGFHGPLDKVMIFLIIVLA